MTIRSDGEDAPRIGKIESVLPAGDRQRLTEFAGSIGEIAAGHSSTRAVGGSTHIRRPGSPSEQNRLGRSLPHRDHVQAVVHPIDEIDVGATRFTPHGLGSRGSPPAESVAGRVIQPEIGLDLVEAQRNDAFRGRLERGSCRADPGQPPPSGVGRIRGTGFSPRRGCPRSGGQIWVQSSVSQGAPVSSAAT